MISIGNMPEPRPPTADDEDLLAIGAVAQILNVSIQTLRRWEKNGLIITARRTPTGHRRYRRGDIERLLTNEAS